MACAAALKLVSFPSFSIHNPCLLSTFHNFPSTFPSISPYPNSTHSKPFNKHYRIWQQSNKFSPLCLSYRFYADRADHQEDDDDAENCSFDEAVELFNRREYYKCHDYLEALWNKAEEPTRTMIHGILQCAVGFHHLFNQNHRGAMMELGEGLCKLKKMNFKSGPFHEFEQDISAALDFIYQTQIELAACSEDLCIAMDQSERSYQLLGGYGAGQRLYNLQSESDSNNQNMYIVFCPQSSYGNGTKPTKVKLPTLYATTQLLKAYEYN
ncbi:hypothetical protein FNV43_RR15277 [Rhamnella rubrinervis]|uniref:TTHA0068-like domain-containing protein n=1 Tax=Rhamnella rubrinervis TaxID=2594499 RepID=A0A8K0E7H4_9ROSA|nr:hypothetical protein FNV43_RR15277 [Rhamnella rubrinervis]